MLVVALLVFSVFFYGDLFSYIDPGTGSFLIQLLIAFFAGSLFFAKSFYKNAKKFISKTLNVSSGKIKKN